MKSAGLWLLAVGLVLDAQSVSVPRAAVMRPGSTDDRIRAAERQLSASPNDAGLQGALAAAYLQKLRETGDGGYLQRAEKLVERMEPEDGGSSLALRLQNEIDLQRHEFRAVAERARSMTKYAPSDPGNWGNLGDALMELGEYEGAGEAYQKMFTLRPNLASYNRLAFYRFVSGDAADANRDDARGRGGGRGRAGEHGVLRGGTGRHVFQDREDGGG
jgi:cytochrome c-type biogenesis protein CcmH/NrfG